MEGHVLVKKLLSADNRRRSYRDNSQVYRKSRQVMIVNKAYRYRIYPTTAQKMMFAKTFGCVRFIYNKMLSDRIDYYKETGQKLNNTPAQYKEEFPWLKEVDSLALANAQMNLNKAYSHFWNDSKHFGKPRFKSKKNSRASYSTDLPGPGFCDAWLVCGFR
ncbi:helix-turn-helix domain-containing protein [uncultured Megasphaera sp.]|uniref:helix-turn-helix domain-containing protein n=1 Tax=uncultured Megasphaera sp. TaxID=165188 RepID=UPI0034A0C0C1